MDPYITQEELALMSETIRIITLELAMRFLNDYINGDTYFKINYPTHNLDRARNQLALVKDIENKMDDIKAYISESYKKHINELPEKPKVKVNKKYILPHEESRKRSIFVVLKGFFSLKFALNYHS